MEDLARLVMGWNVVNVIRALGQTKRKQVAIVIIILSLLGIAATTFVIVVFIIYRNEHLIKASSRELSAVLLCGIMLCYLMPLFT